MAPGSQEDFDLIIIGSGVYGIQAARTYLELHPTDRIVILEADSCPGGVWGANRSYEAFWTQSPLEMWEYSDQPLRLPEGTDTHHMYFPAKHFTKYLDEYLDSHVYAGKTLRERLVLNARVEKLWKEQVIWRARVGSGLVYAAPKVIDASGQTSTPNVPKIPGADTFKGTIIHHRDFGRSDILQSCKRVVVLGGGKSSADVAYAAAKAGLNVSWVIRKSGNGPAAFFPPDSPISYYQNSNEAFHHRFMASLSVCVFTPESWWTWALNRTPVGRGFLRSVWSFLHGELQKRAEYGRADRKDNGFANLKPDTELFWQNDSSGVCQRADFFDTIGTKVQVYRQDMDRIDANSVYLADGTSIETGAIVYATGWRHSTPYIDPATAYSLGLSTDPAAEDAQEAKKWSDLEKAADAMVLQRFPILASHSPCYKPERKETPFRLYKSILPVHDHSIAFLGKMTLANHTYNAEPQSLFAIAALDGTLALPPEPEMEEEVALVRAWQERRYPAKGMMGNWFYFDVVPYTDALLAQMGLESHRASGVSDFFRPAVQRNLRGLLDEWKEGVGRFQDKGTKEL